MKKTLALAALAAAFATSSAQAADLGGNCCADLEERIAELEATTAKKGNRKVSLQVYGQVNVALTSIDSDFFDKTSVNNAAGDSENTFVGFSGRAQVSTDISAGYVLEIQARELGLLGAVSSGLEPDVRQSFFWLRSENLGTIALGLQGTATNDFDRITTANTSVASRPFSLQPISDWYLTGLDYGLDGGYRNAVRYITPTWNGFTVSAAWSAAEAGIDGISSGDAGDTWDAALRYANEFGGFKLAAGIGYRHDEDLSVNIAGITTIALGDVTERDTFLVSGSAMHIASGLFLSVYYDDQQWDKVDLDIKALAIQGGIETKIFALGKSTFFAEWGQTDVSLYGSEASIDTWGLGYVQAVDGAALDLYLTYKKHDGTEIAPGLDVDVIQAGARMKF